MFTVYIDCMTLTDNLSDEIEFAWVRTAEISVEDTQELYHLACQCSDDWFYRLNKIESDGHDVTKRYEAWFV